QTEAHSEGDQARLRAVVDVALDPAQLGVLRVDGTRPRRLEPVDAPGEPGSRRMPGGERVDPERDRHPERDPRGPEVAAARHRPDEREEDDDDRNGEAEVDREALPEEPLAKA